MDNSKKTAIEVKNLNVIFDDKEIDLRTLQDISFKIQNHSFVSIIGPSGCGKSTLFKIIGDILHKEKTRVKGTIEIFGQTTEEARKQRKVGLIFQTPTLFEWRSVIKNVELPLEIIKIKKSARKEKAMELLKLVELENYANYNPSQLSGGMQQRVSIARALAYDPEILLMDEPFGALDEITRRKMNDELIRIWQKTQKTILFVTHSIQEAVYLSQEIIVLSKRPGHIKDIIDIKFPYPRDKIITSSKFIQKVESIRKIF